jgi:Flp pilus assembly pilin Flp
MRAIRRGVPLATDEGATAVEYAIFAALVAAVIVATVLVLGVHVRDLFCSAVEGLNSLGMPGSC